MLLYAEGRFVDGPHIVFSRRKKTARFELADWVNLGLAGLLAGIIGRVAQKEADVDALRTALKSAKGPGNSRNLFMYAPNGRKDGIQLIPVSEVAAKDEFGSIKNISRDDMLAALRIPPQLMGIVPQNAGGFGSIKEAAQIWAINELEPIQSRLQHVNEWLGEEVARF